MRRRVIIIFSVVIAITTVVVAWVVLSRPPVGAYIPVVTAMSNGTIAIPAGAGIVQLPAAFAGLTPKNEVIVERRAGGRLFILFPTWYGRGADLEGWLYTSGPLVATDYYTIDWGTGGVHQHLDVADCKMLSVGRPQSSWCAVSRRLD